MRAAALLCAAGCLVAACERAAPLPATDLAVRVEGAPGPVEPGRAFPLAVVRLWSRDLVPAEWSDRALAPLAVRLESVERREDGDRVEETRRYGAYAFARTDVVVPSLRLSARPKDGGPERAARAPALRVRVRPTVDAAAPGAPEDPGEPPPRPAPWGAVAAAAAAALAALVLLRLRRRRRGAAPPPPLPSPPASGPLPHEAALARLAALRADGAAAPGAVVLAVAEAVRAYLADAFGVPASQRSTEEAAAALRAFRGGAAGGPDDLARALGPCDLVKFAALAPDARTRDEALARAEAFVRATAPSGGAP